MNHLPTGRVPEETVLSIYNIRPRLRHRYGSVAVATPAREDEGGNAARCWCNVIALVLLGLVLLIAVSDATAALVRPLEGSGNFHTVIDVYNRWRDDGKLDVVLLFAVANNEVNFVARNGHYQGLLQITAELRGPDGSVVSGEKTVTLLADHPDEVGSNTLQQVFPLIMQDVSLRSGRIYCRVEDLNQRRRGLYNTVKGKHVRSEAAGDWVVATPRRQTTDLSVNGPIFMAHAPVEIWDSHQTLALEQAAIFDYLHPNRRYGLEQDHLQVYFEIEPPVNSEAGVIPAGLHVQVLAKDLEFAMYDTISFDDKQHDSLTAGAAVGVFYEMDVNQLPPGAYQLSCAPVDAAGRGWVAEFDVMWNLATLSRHRDELLGEGRTVLRGQELKDFLHVGQAEQEVMLEAFWTKLDPDPSTLLNEVYVDFRRRVAYVIEHLGGFDKSGAVDPRGHIFLLLGQPGEIKVESMPMNASDQEDAFVKIYDRYSPDREGTQIKGSDPSGSQNVSPWTRQGGVQLDYTIQARRDIYARRSSTRMLQAFEIWQYDHAGQHLFPNQYSEQTLGLNFLFVDRNGTGHFVLEQSNAYDVGMGAGH